MNHEKHSNVPHWAKRADDYGKQRWNKEKPIRNRRGEYIGSIIWNLIWLYVVNHLTGWDVKCITHHFSAVLWALNMNILIQIGGNILMFIFDIRFVRNISRIVLEAANFLTLIILYYIFPFDFSVYPGLIFLNWLVPLLVIIGMVVSALKVLSNLWKLVFWRD
jgi:hypothetical protein